MIVLAEVALAVSLTQHPPILAVFLLKSTNFTIVTLVLQHRWLAAQRDLYSLTSGAIAVSSIKRFVGGILTTFTERCITLANIALSTTPLECAVTPTLARLWVNDTMFAALGIVAHAVITSDSTPIQRAESVRLGALSELRVGILALLAYRLTHGGFSVETWFAGLSPRVFVATILPN